MQLQHMLETEPVKCGYRKFWGNVFGLTNGFPNIILRLGSGFTLINLRFQEFLSIRSLIMSHIGYIDSKCHIKNLKNQCDLFLLMEAHEKSEILFKNF